MKELDKAGGVGVARLKRYFGEKFPEYHVEVKTYLLINALERLVGTLQRWRSTAHVPFCRVLMLARACYDDGALELIR